ncbi:MAG TPA: hypothetical protein VIJ25_13860 [Methylococcales bacterium]
MLAVEHYPSSDFFGNYPLNDFPKHELLEVNRSKVSIHNAKAGYSYPTIRLPYSFSMLAGLPTQIYQTVHKGALAFLVVISKGAATENSADLSENAQINKTSVFTRRRSGVRIAPGPSFFLQSDTLETSIGAFSDTRIMAKKKHKKDKKLYNFDEKLHNSNELDLTWQEEVDLQPEDEVEGGSEIYYFTDEDGNIHSREFLAEELIPDENRVEDSLKRRTEEKLQKLKPGAVDIISLRAPGEPSQQVTLPAPKSGGPPLDIRISSEIVPDLSTRDESQQRSNGLAADKPVAIYLHDGSDATEPVSIAHNRDTRTCAPESS